MVGSEVAVNGVGLRVSEPAARASEESRREWVVVWSDVDDGGERSDGKSAQEGRGQGRMISTTAQHEIKAKTSHSQGRAGGWTGTAGKARGAPTVMKLRCLAALERVTGACTHIGGRRRLGHHLREEYLQPLDHGEQNTADRRRSPCCAPAAACRKNATCRRTGDDGVPWV